MSVFCGPLVEGTFNIVDAIITDDRTSLTIQKYGACSLIKYYLRSQGKKSTTLIPGHKMRQNSFSARRIYHENLKEKKKTESSKQALTSSPPKQAETSMHSEPEGLNKRKASSLIQDKNGKKVCSTPKSDHKVKENLKATKINFFMKK
ncbi:hypothetical protein AVEN_195709-1 [Araneus ventricosus]|uniref:Uncharacterized protein n=1 Tax=Araneus ventricosus TaxID=182803 RepID=A0A4Y2VG63_ARAVE|nr:hypothetical protein AVEN_195709-1 [Araneus ventricosus]